MHAKREGWGSVSYPQSLPMFPMASSHMLPSLLQVKMVEVTVWGQSGNPAQSKQGCSCWPSLDSIPAAWWGALSMVFWDW